MSVENLIKKGVDSARRFKREKGTREEIAQKSGELFNTAKAILEDQGSMCWLGRWSFQKTVDQKGHPATVSLFASGGRNLTCINIRVNDLQEQLSSRRHLSVNQTSSSLVEESYRKDKHSKAGVDTIEKYSTYVDLLK